MKDKNNHKHEVEKDENLDTVEIEDVNETPAEESEEAAEAAETEEVTVESLEKEVDDLKAQLEKEKKEYMFLMAEFDNFRKRTLREKSELIKNAAESTFKGLLPTVDDIERAISASEKTDDPAVIREGMELIHKKLRKFMQDNGVREMDPEDKEFDADRHEAISAVPVADEAQKGKILDTIEKGYTINDKVLRHAKVVVGQ